MFLILQDVISYGCGGDMMFEYKFLIYYYEDKLKWQEIVKVIVVVVQICQIIKVIVFKNFVNLLDCEGDCFYENLL